MPHLSLFLFGGFKAALDDIPVTRFRSDKVRALLAFLAVEQDRPHRREALTGLFWSEQSEKDARHNLSETLWRLRQALHDDDSTFVHANTKTIQFSMASDHSLDVAEFLRATDGRQATVSDLQSAVELYRGDFLAGFTVPDAAPFEEWLLVTREHLQRLATTALSQLTVYYEAQGAAGYAQAERYARRHIELEAWHEEPYRVLMRLYAAQNQTEQAIAMYHALTRVLHHELNLEPSHETNALYKHLRNQSAVIRLQSPVSNLQSPISNLPFPATPLVGRETELAQLSEKITRTDCRLLTLVGQGGIGKTRLALETARANQQAFPRGVYFVDLANLDAPEMIPHAMADALHFQFRGAGSPEEQLVEHLRAWNEPALLLLDNFEQIIGGASFVSQMLERAPQVRCLATSRERLNTRGEWLFEVEGLRAGADLPARLRDDWGASEAMQLFVQCAARLNVNAHNWSDDEKRAAIRITQLVEGMPLALELASAWLQTLTPREIADEIAHGLDAFEHTRRDVPQRHASIRAVFEHSWKLLTPTEQQAFARLSVLRGGFTREAAREIAYASLQTLSALGAKSLVKRAVGNRFRMHELVRQFAAEKLAESSKGEALADARLQFPTSSMQRLRPNPRAETQTRHAHYFLNLLAVRRQELDGALARDALAELRRDAENLRAAWQWAVQHADWNALQRSVEPLAYFYHVAGLLQEGEALLRETLNALELTAPPALGAQLYVSLADFSLRMTRYPQAIDAAEKGLALARAANEIQAQVRAEWILGAAIDRHSRDAAGETHLRNALATAEQFNLPALQAHVLFALGQTYDGRVLHLEAHAPLTRALELARETNEQRLESDILTLLARIAYHRADADECRELLERALLLKRKLGDPFGQVRIYITLGNSALLLYQLDQGLVWYQQAATLAREIGEHSGLLFAVNNHAGVLQAVGQYDAARAEYDENFKRAQELGETFVIHQTLFWRALLENATGNPTRALVYAEEQRALAESQRAALELANARERMADAQLQLGNLQEAETLFQHALPVYQEKGKRDYVLRCQAGLARIAVQRGDTERALALAVPLRAALLEKFPNIDAEPLRLFWMCYQVLRACSDPSATALLQYAHARLLHNAAQIQDERVRTSYLENIAWHREIQRAHNSA